MDFSDNAVGTVLLWMLGAADRPRQLDAAPHGRRDSGAGFAVLMGVELNFYCLYPWIWHECLAPFFTMDISLTSLNPPVIPCSEFCIVTLYPRDNSGQHPDCTNPRASRLSMLSLLSLNTQSSFPSCSQAEMTTPTSVLPCSILTGLLIHAPLLASDVMSFFRRNTPTWVSETLGDNVPWTRNDVMISFTLAFIYTKPYAHPLHRPRVPGPSQRAH